MKPSICQDKDFFYLADAIDASPRLKTPLPLLDTTLTIYDTPNCSDPYLESPQETGPRTWNPKWPSRAEWVKKNYLEYRALSPSERVTADFYRARSDRYLKEMNERSNDQYRGSLTFEELDRALDKFQTLLPPNHIPGTNPHQEDSAAPRWAEECTPAHDNYVDTHQDRLPPIPSTPSTPVADDAQLATPRMTRKSSTLESFLSFMTPKTIGSIRQRKGKKIGKASFTVL